MRRCATQVVERLVFKDIGHFQGCEPLFQSEQRTLAPYPILDLAVACLHWGQKLSYSPYFICQVIHILFLRYNCQS